MLFFLFLLSEKKKAEMEQKLDAMTDEEKQEWLNDHKKRGRKENCHEKPIDMTDEEWKQKKAERKQKNKR
ncbi:hypothetical protein IKG31_02470 [Candidatus Saccharibacteria bacterium]|nr:hypothetical protein [Candidatus Saccharibacteria bacterium]